MMTMEQQTIRQVRGSADGRGSRRRQAVSGAPAMAVAYQVALARFRAEFARLAPSARKDDLTQLRAWDYYAELLDETTVTTSKVKALHEVWSEADRKRRDLALRKYVPAAPVSQDELRAPGSVREFSRLLSTLLERSGESAVVIAGRTPADGPGKIGVSQVYYLINPDRRSLPRKEDQIRAFGEACGLDKFEIELLLQTWSRLKNHARVASSSRAGAAQQSERWAPTAPGMPTVDGVWAMPATEHDLLRWVGTLARDTKMTNGDTLVALVAIGVLVLKQATDARAARLARAS